jgi:hypothetical protein
MAMQEEMYTTLYSLKRQVDIFQTDLETYARINHNTVAFLTHATFGKTGCLSFSNGYVYLGHAIEIGSTSSHICNYTAT